MNNKNQLMLHIINPRIHKRTPFTNGIQITYTSSTTSIPKRSMEQRSKHQSPTSTPTKICFGHVL